MNRLVTFLVAIVLVGAGVVAILSSGPPRQS
jgi:hypothetical protein